MAEQAEAEQKMNLSVRLLTGYLLLRINNRELCRYSLSIEIKQVIAINKILLPYDVLDLKPADSVMRTTEEKF